VAKPFGLNYTRYADDVLLAANTTAMSISEQI
jgi:hypothetical protein